MSEVDQPIAAEVTTPRAALRFRELLKQDQSLREGFNFIRYPSY